jgi:neutral trehalase
MESLKESVLFDTLLNPTCLIAEKYGYKWEGGRSGMDNTPRGRTGEHAVGQRPNNPDMLWIDAICQQALSAKMISKLFTIIDDKESVDAWNKKYEEKKDIVNEFYWDKADGFYYDIDNNTHDFYKIMSIASYWTLISEIAPEERADELVKKLTDPEIFSGFTSFLSLSRKDNDYSPKGRYWRGSVWLPTAYMTLKGLVKYGYIKEA